jgi:hypothetical protein
MVAFVQKASNSSQASATTIVVTPGAAMTNGNTVHVAVTSDDTNTTCTLKDNNNVTWTAIDSVDDTPNGVILYTFRSPTGGVSGSPTSLTATFGAAVTFRAIGMQEWSGVDVSAAPLDGHDMAVKASSTTPTSNSITTAANGDAIIGSLTCDTTGTVTITAGTGFTLRNVETTVPYGDESQIQSSAGAVTASFNFDTSQGSIISIVAFKASTSATSIAPILRRPIQFRPFAQAPFLNRFPPGGSNAPPQLADTIAAKLDHPIRFHPFAKAPWLNRSLPAPPPVTEITVLPGFGSLTLTGPPPALALRIFSGFGGITLNGQAPLLRTTVKPGFGSLTLTGLAPKLAFINRPGFGSIVLTGFAPTASITSGQTALPGIGQLILTGRAPSLAAKVFPGTGAILLTGNAPTLRRAALAGFGSIVLTGKAPSLAFIDRPGFGSVVLTGKAPSLRRTTPAGFGSIILTGKAPVVQLSGSVTALPGFGALRLNGFVPTTTGGTSAKPTFPEGTLWGYWRDQPRKRRKPTLLEILADVIEDDPPPFAKASGGGPSKLEAKTSRRQKARARAEAQQWAEEIVGRAQREAKSYELDFAKAAIATALREHAATLIDAAVQRRVDQEEEEALLLLLSHYH